MNVLRIADLTDRQKVSIIQTQIGLFNLAKKFCVLEPIGRYC
jgi:hypothetical protein